MRSGQLGKPGHGMGREIYKFSYRRLHPWDLRLMGCAGYRYEVPRSSSFPESSVVANSFRSTAARAIMLQGLIFIRNSVWSKSLRINQGTNVKIRQDVENEIHPPNSERLTIDSNDRRDIFEEGVEGVTVNSRRAWNGGTTQHPSPTNLFYLLTVTDSRPLECHFFPHLWMTGRG